MTSGESRMDIEALAKEMRANSERWFPELHAGHVDLEVFYALGLANEAGEAAGAVKKIMRGGKTDKAVEQYENLAEEMADTFTYLLLLADECGVDLVKEYRAKVIVNEARWGSG